MSCESYRDHIELLIDGELDKASALELEAHIAACRWCANELSLARRVKETLGSLPRLECPDGVTERAAAAIAAAERSPAARPIRVSRRLQWRPVVATALAALLVIAVGLVGERKRHDGEASRRRAEIAQVEVKLALAYFGDVTRRAERGLREDVFGRHLVEPVERAVRSTFGPIHEDVNKEDENAG